MPQSFAERAGPKAADQAEAEAADIKLFVPGQTVIVLKSGHVLAGQLIPAAVRKRKGVVDDQGRPVYDIDWQIASANLMPSALEGLSKIKLSS